MPDDGIEKQGAVEGPDLQLGRQRFALRQRAGERVEMAEGVHGPRSVVVLHAQQIAGRKGNQ